MSASHPPVSIHPYFKIDAGKLDEARALLPLFVDKTDNEEGCRWYEFTLNGDVLFCREGYRDAAGVLAHLENVGDLLGQLLEMSELQRLEIHGPAAELEKLKEPLAHLNPEWFEYACGMGT